MSRNCVRAAVLILVAGCGGGKPAAPPAQAAAPTPVAPPKPAAAPPSAEQASKKFAELTKDIEKLGKGEAVDRAWLQGQLEAILKIEPRYAPARFNLAVLRERDGDKAGARRAYEDIVRDSPEFAPAQENLAAAYVTEGRRDEAIAIYKRVIEREPKDVTGRLALARLLTEQKKYDEAIALSRDALKHQADAIEAFRILAACYEAQGNPRMAELIIGRGLKVNKDDTELRYLLANMLLDKNELAGGIAKLKEIVALDPKWLKVRAQLAGIALKYRDFGNAAQQFEAILKEDPKNREAKVGLAVSYKGMGRFEAAEKLYLEVLADSPNETTALWDLAVLYHRNLNKYDEAIATYRKLKTVAPGDEKAGEVDKLVSEIDKVKNDLAARRAREERERKKREAVDAACVAVAAGKKPTPEAIGNDQERTEEAWQRMSEAQQILQNPQQALQKADVTPEEAIKVAEDRAKCAFAIMPDTPSARTEVCAPMHVMWTQILYQLGRLDDAIADNKLALKCDPKNPDAQLIEQQLKEIAAQQKGAEAQPASAPAPEAATPPPPHGGKKRKGK